MLKKRIRERGYRRQGKVPWRDPAKKAALTAKRDAMKLRAMPKWADKGKIADVFAAAARVTKFTGIKHEVDHIVPLLNPTVCGLHWEGNLRVITESENAAKKNHFNPDDPDGLAFLKVDAYTPRGNLVLSDYLVEAAA